MFLKGYPLEAKAAPKYWNLVTLIFTKKYFLSTREYQTHSSRSIRTPLESINHALKYRFYEKFYYFGAHFTEIRGFAMKEMLKMS